jgi:enoyl-CoA hydratase/carnithine racemase
MSAVIAEAHDDHLHLRLADPARRNPLGLEVLRNLRSAIVEAGRSEARVLVIEAEGLVFSAGHDLKEIAAGEAAFQQDLFDACVELMTTVHAAPQPVIAAVDGLATAAGVQLVATCDLVVATERAAFATPGVRIGLFCSTPMVPLVRCVGQKRALEMLLTGNAIDAATAQAWGLVNRVVPEERLSDAVHELVAEITPYSAQTLATGKRTFYDQLSLDEAEAYSLTKQVMVANAVDAVAREGVEAFLAKRAPVWPA